MAGGGGDDPTLAAGDVDERDLRGRELIRRLLSRDRELRAVARPGEPVDIEPSARQGRRDRRPRLTLRTPPSRDRRVDQPDLAPAPATRDEREAATVRGPARVPPPARFRDDLRQP